jgi:hypothetical protein
MRVTSVHLVAVVASVGGLAGWHLIDRPTMLQSAFAVGLPNFSRTTEIEQDSLGCAILAPEATYEGVLITAFEVASFSAQWRSPHALRQRDELLTRLGFSLRRHVPQPPCLSCALISVHWGGHGHSMPSPCSRFRTNITQD